MTLLPHSDDSAELAALEAEEAALEEDEDEEEIQPVSAPQPELSDGACSYFSTDLLMFRR